MNGAAPRRIWLCADDYGISPGVNRAIRDLIERGRLNATSVMMVGPSIGRDEAAAVDGRYGARAGWFSHAPSCCVLAAEVKARDGPSAAFRVRARLSSPGRPGWA